MQDLLITDYVYIAGAGAALVNAGIVTMYLRRASLNSPVIPSTALPLWKWA